MSGPRVAVVGGGVAGLAAAHALRGRAEVTVLEGAPRVGGKLLAGRVGGRVVDLGAEMVLLRQPDALDLVRALGRGGDLVHPRTTAARVLVRGETCPLPGGTLLGIPTDADALRGLLPADDLARLEAEPQQPHPPLGADVAVGVLVRERLGDVVADYLVDPLLGGVYAGRADALSLRATVPRLADELARDGSLVRAARAAAAAARGVDGPVFGSLRQGLASIVPDLAAGSAARVVTATVVRRLQRRPDGGWRLVTGPTTDEQHDDVDAVVLAVPAPSASRLLSSAGIPTHGLEDVELASSALVSVAWAPGERLPDASGVLVPGPEGLAVKAVTWSSRKWAHLDDGGMVHARASLGRAGEVDLLQQPDAVLAEVALRDLRALGAPSAEPVDVVVTRWGGGLPQYAPGHLDRVAALRADLPATLAVCGAAYDGVGVPACVRSGLQAAVRLSSAWSTASRHGS